jgi:hypothetical protein
MVSGLSFKVRANGLGFKVEGSGFGALGLRIRFRGVGL